MYCLGSLRTGFIRGQTKNRAERAKRAQPESARRMLARRIQIPTYGEENYCHGKQTLKHLKHDVNTSFRFHSVKGINSAKW